MAGRLHYQFEWRLALFTLVMVPLMIGLGFWQLSRADDKAALAAAFEAQRLQAPAPLAGLAGVPATALAYRPVVLEGRYLPEYLLLDNRVQQGRYGNEVLALFELADGSLALVNRGWMAADPARLTLPSPPGVTGLQRVTGHVYVAPGEAYVLADEGLPEGWPKRVQALDTAALAAVLPAALFPHPVRLDAGQPGALSIDWQVINASPEKHLGYAVQWFAMAAVLALLYLLRSTNIWQRLRGRGNDGDRMHD